MSDGTVKVTAEAHLHINQLMCLLQGPLNDVLSQITAHGNALTDLTNWEGPAATAFATQLWPEVSGTLGQLTGSLGNLQQQVAGILNNITQAGSSLPVVGGVLPAVTGILPNVGGIL